MPQEKKNILIVEDEKPMARALQLKLERAGYAAEMVLNGEAALNLLLKKKFDLVILDLVMPRMDGFRLLQELADRHIVVTSIVISNLSQAEDEKKALLLGASAFIIKSDVSLADIIERVHLLIGTS